MSGRHYTFNPHALASCFISDPQFPALRRMALFLDFDGTLAPLQDDAGAVHLPKAMAQVLIDLSAKLGMGPILISGRDLDDLSARTPTGLTRLGNHGLRRATAGEASAPRPPSLPNALQDQLQHILKDYPDCFAEQKTSVVAVHYRAAPDVHEALKTRLSALPLAAHDYHLEAGKMIFELKPNGASKGAALAKEMKNYPDLIPVMFGDDTTDEAAMAAAQDLGGIGVKIGAGESCADIRLNLVEDVHALLKTWARDTDGS